MAASVNLWVVSLSAVQHFSYAFPESGPCFKYSSDFLEKSLTNTASNSEP